MTQRMTHGISFTQCPECSYPIGQRGLARHREAAHGVAPAVKKLTAAEREVRDLLKTAGGDKAAVARALDHAERIKPEPRVYRALRAALEKA